MSRGTLVGHRPIGTPLPPPTEVPPTTQTYTELFDRLDEETRAWLVGQALLSTGKGKRALIQRLRDSIESYAEELVLTNTGDTSEKWNAYSLNLIEFDSLIVYTAGAITATLTLGTRTLPLPAGLVSIPFQTGFILKPGDPRSVVYSGATTAPGFIWLLGKQLPEVNF
jgi:hypothetical protein